MNLKEANEYVLQMREYEQISSRKLEPKSNKWVFASGFLEGHHSRDSEVEGLNEKISTQNQSKEILEEKLKNREQLILQQYEKIAAQKEVIERLTTGLEKTKKWSTIEINHQKYDLGFVEEVLDFVKEKLG